MNDVATTGSFDLALRSAAVRKVAWEETDLAERKRLLRFSSEIDVRAQIQKAFAAWRAPRTGP